MVFHVNEHILFSHATFWANIFNPFRKVVEDPLHFANSGSFAATFLFLRHGNSGHLCFGNTLLTHVFVVSLLFGDVINCKKINF